MIQRTVKVKEATTTPTKDGKKTYLSAVLSDGTRESKYSIFDPNLQKILQEAHKSGESVNVGLEKEGNFWNVKTAVITSEEVVTEQKETKPTWKPSGKSPEEQASIERQVDKKNAVEIYCHVTEQGTPFDAEQLRKIFKACRALALDIVEEAKKGYGAVEK